MEDITLYTRYQDLPNRYIIKRKPLNKVKRSYGTIVYWEKDGKRKWLLVQRRLSIEFYLIISGNYRKSEIPKLLKGISTKERHKIEESIYSPERFRSIFYSCGLNTHDLDHAMDTFGRNRLYIHTIMKESPTLDETEYFWPKGRNNYGENGFDAAKRECLEETGVDVNAAQLMSDSPVNFRFVGINNNIYETSLWIYRFNGSLPPVLKTSDTSEISNVIWTDEPVKYLDREKITTLYSAEKIINY